MTTLVWIIVGCWLGYCAGRLVSAFKYLPLIDRMNWRNADLERRINNLLDWNGDDTPELTKFRAEHRITNHA